MDALILGIGIFFIAAVAFLILIIRRIRQHQNFVKSLNYVVLRVRLPKTNPKLQPEAIQKSLPDQISPFEQFVINLMALKIPLTFEVAVENVGEEITFYVGAPRNFVDIIAKQIQSFWSGSEVEIFLKDYNIFNPKGTALAATILQKSPWYFSVKTYPVIGAADPFEAILGAFSKLAKEGEGLAYQVMFRPASSDLIKQIQAGIKKLKEGKNVKEAFSGDIMKEVSGILGAVSPPSEKDKAKEMERPKIIDENAIKNLEAKVQKPLFEVNARLVASAENQERASIILRNITGAFTQYTNPNFNQFYSREFSGGSLPEFVSKFSYRIFEESQKNVLNSEELASIFHFPLPSCSVPNISWLKSRSAPPPVNLPDSGLTVGRSLWGGDERIIRLTEDDRRRHLYVIGQTGTGKTVFMQEMIRQDIEAGRGLCFIDPHGDAAERILGFVPKERIDDVIYFDPGDLDRPIGLNMLEYDARFPEHKSRIIDEILVIIDQLYNLKETGGPMFERYFRGAMRLIMDDPSLGSTFLELPRVFTNEEFRRDLLAKCKDGSVREFWLKEAERVSGEASLENMAPYIASKLDNFTNNDFIRPIIAQRKSTINFRDIMDNKKILIVNLSKGKIGDLNAYLLGMVVVARLLMSALSRVDTPEEQRQDFYLYVDEFQNFITKSVGTILSEARKYRLSLIIAHQFIGQLPDEIKNAVFGNVGTIVSFRIGVSDAEFMEKQYSPVFNQTDLINLDNRNAYIRLLIHGIPSQPFNFLTMPMTQPNFEMVSKMKELSRMKYGKDRAEIEKEVEERYRENP